MRDAFDHYFTGWTLFADPTPAEKAEFALLVAAMEASFKTDSDLAEAWRVHPFDGKKDAFVMVFHRYTAKHGIRPEFQAVAQKILAKYPAK